MHMHPKAGIKDDADDDDRYLTLTALTHYSGLSHSTLKRYLRDPQHPLPYYQVGAGRGRVLVKKGAFDAWMDQFKPRAAAAEGDPDVSWIGRKW